jgi:hypothetical protein
VARILAAERQAALPLMAQPKGDRPVRTAAELRAEASRMQEFTLTVTDRDVLEEINALMTEWERRARLLDDGDATK